MPETPSLAVVTMAYNEGELLPVWCRHYAAAAGAAQCYVIDHGSTDGSTESLGEVNRVRIPRSPQDDTRRTRFLSEFCASLLNWYDAVIHVDVDELLVADPSRFPSLSAYASAVEPGGVRTAIGFDVIHQQDEEPAIDWARPISEQRHWLRFSSAMCKPVLIRRAVTWAPGFHCIDDTPAFDDLYLFHLRYADQPSGLARLTRTREQPWASAEAGQHQRMPDTDWNNMLRGMSGLPRRDDISLGTDDVTLGHWVGRVTESTVFRKQDLYRLDLHISGEELWRLPQRFIGTF
ncbi:glycosyltransferase family 2 protein [Acetobacter fallax]|uniref:Glycosyltransferase family 2 protein n=1 Tax=Acetobacter fallax TaxID=1737473 RepID=A0ABX0K551_9PROT|nr:glycosyltransferase family 2 protein [Acetobacter fallax]NHO31010.1 glycosyltransferase family 2 protein [Acetobacter fallax]NHO34567.1 glycosyltransferase family 2 protein [Acetobacter fallax]